MYNDCTLFSIASVQWLYTWGREEEEGKGEEEGRRRRGGGGGEGGGWLQGERTSGLSLIPLKIRKDLYIHVWSCVFVCTESVDFRWLNQHDWLILVHVHVTYLKSTTGQMCPNTCGRLPLVFVCFHWHLLLYGRRLRGASLEVLFKAPHPIGQCSVHMCRFPNNTLN